MAKRKPKLPIHIKVAGTVYHLPERDDYLDGKGNLGETDPNTLIILVHTEMEQQKRRVVAWHEVLHAVTNAYNTGSELSEEQVRGLTEGTFQVMRDNPELMRYILAD